MRAHGRIRAIALFTFHKPNAAHLLFFLLLFLAMNTANAAPKPAQTGNQYPSGSWGLGVVVPEGSKLTDGGDVSWANATAVSLTLTLPNINSTDHPILAVESLMATDGSVMQIAAGLYPNQTTWLAYGWYIKHVQAYPQSYDWILNSSEPTMPPETQVSLSIFLSQGRWQYSIENLNTHQATTGEYEANVPPHLQIGDQEVFALESYSTTDAVFANMRKLTLHSLTINGKQVANGWYPYGSWNTHYNPLFVVGGLDPPLYISLQKEEGATLVWSYQQWSSPTQTPPQNLPLTLLIGIPALAAILVLTIAYIMKRRTPA